MSIDKKLQVLVGLDLSEMDQHLLHYLQILDQILNIEKVHFIHNLKMGELPKELLVPEKIAFITNKIKDRLEQQIRESQAIYRFEIEVKLERYSELAFMQSCQNNSYDLLILGNKQELEGNGGLAQKLVRILPCPTLLVPETFKTPMTTIIDAIDFSKYTASIMNWADRFKNNSKGQEINHSAVYISKFNWGFLPSMTNQDIRKATLADIDKKQKTWNEKYSNYSKIEIEPAAERSIATSLLQYANKHQANMLILGVKGATGITDIFMGSVANDLIQRPTNTCLLFVKPDKN